MEESAFFFYLRLRGLPWSASKQDIIDFLKNVQIREGNDSIIFTLSEEGKRSGDALVVVVSKEDYDKALSYNRNYIGRRYIEVVPSDLEEFQQNQQKATLGEDECVMRMRGLPYATTEADIRSFFSGLEIVTDGVVVILDGEGRCSGDAYVEFSNAGCAQAALKKHREKIGNRFIEIFRSCKLEMSYVGNARATPLMSINIKRRRESRSSPRRRRSEDECDYYSQERRGREERSYERSEPYVSIEKFIHMRGLPYGCVEEEIDEFFAPLPLVSVGFIYNQDGKFNGECDVYFERDSDVYRAMNNDRKRIGKRYVELFMRSKKTASRNKPRDDYYYHPPGYSEAPRKYQPLMMHTEPSSAYHPFPHNYHQSSISAVSDPYSKAKVPGEESCSPYMAPCLPKHNQPDYYSSIEPKLIRSSNEFYDPSSQVIPSTKESDNATHNPKYIEQNSSISYKPDDQFYPYN